MAHPPKPDRSQALVLLRKRICYESDWVSEKHIINRRSSITSFPRSILCSEILSLDYLSLSRAGRQHREKTLNHPSTLRFGLPQGVIVFVSGQNKHAQKIYCIICFSTAVLKHFVCLVLFSEELSLLSKESCEQRS